MNALLSEKIKLLPTDPGCYLMKDQHGDIIYVGKAKNLKNRVSSYFSGAHDHKTTKMVSQVVDFDLMLTSTEKESLILEINLIKKHRPKFNILFMDDKSYPYLRLPKTGKPVVTVARDRKRLQGYTYFGPYPNATAARDMAEILNHSTPIDGVLLPNTQAIYDAFNRNKTSYTQQEYKVWRDQIISILNGNVEEFYQSLQSKMMQASDAMRYELAGNYKQQMDAIDYIADRQQVQYALDEQFDVFHFAFHQGYLAIVGLFVRRGQLIERTMAVEASLEEPMDAFISYIVQFYEQHPLPKKVYVPQSIPVALLSDVLSVDVLHAIRGKKRALIDIAERNATQALEQQFHILKKQSDQTESALATIGMILQVDTPIQRIEIFDNSHIGGTFTVSACVVFDDGVPNKDLYRRYRLHTANDDVASMKEVIYRRYFRILSEGTRFPDVIIVDGGITQLNAAISILSDLDLKIPVCGLVKDEYHRTSGLLLPDGTLHALKVNHPAYMLLVQMQDEVHRFAISYHRLLRKKAMTKSILDEVDGLGPVRQKALFKQFGSMKKMREASIEDLSEVVPQDVAAAVYALLHLKKEAFDES